MSSWTTDGSCQFRARTTLGSAGTQLPLDQSVIDGQLSDQRPARPANVGRVQVAISMESLILAQDERWRRA
jgi:hypothetical protein